jgi:hypothetical protein
MSERYRYTGPDASRLLAFPGGSVEFPRLKWVDPEKALDDAHIGLHHLPVVLAGLGDDWEREGPKKAARTRARNTAEADDTSLVGDEPGVEPTDPAEPDEEQS